MRKIPTRVVSQMENDPYYQMCARHGPDCAGRITWEHAFIYAGKQINEVWAIIPLCWHHHLGSGLNKELNQWISIQRATPDDLLKYPNKDWEQLYKYLESKYG